MVGILIFTFEIIKKLAPLGDKFQKAVAGVMVLNVGFEMLPQAVDPLSEHRYLHKRRTGIFIMNFVFLNDFYFLFFVDGHSFNYFSNENPKLYQQTRQHISGLRLN